MKLIITDEVMDSGIDEQHFTIEEFNTVCYHPYIQSVDWEEVIIDLDDRLNRGFVKQLFGRKYKIIPRVKRGMITPHNVLTLIEICPDYAAKFMRAQAEGQEALKKVFKEVGEIYFWY